MFTTRSQRKDHGPSSRPGRREFERAVRDAEPHVRAELLAAAERYEADAGLAVAPAGPRWRRGRAPIAVPVVG